MITPAGRMKLEKSRDGKCALILLTTCKWREYLLVNFDLQGAEWVIVAYLTRDEGMLGVVKSGKSPHIVTGARMSGLPEDLVYADNKMIENKLSDADEIAAARRNDLPDVMASRILPRKQSIRQLSKRINHSGNYKIGYKEFALKFEIDERESRQALELYSKVAYPGLRTWWKSIDDELRKSRTLYNCWGRKCYFMGQVNEEMFKAGYSFIPQSTVGDIPNQAMPKFMNDDSPEFSFARARLGADVHDSLLFDYSNRDLASAARFMIRMGLDYMSPTIDYGEPFKLGVDCKIGVNWRDMHEIKLVPDEAKLIDQLARVCDELKISVANIAA